MTDDATLDDLGTEEGEVIALMEESHGFEAPDPDEPLITVDDVARFLLDNLGDQEAQ